MGSLGPFEILAILLVILLLFGAKRIPEIARGMGKGIREFKDATSDIKKELTVADTPPPPQIPTQAQPRQQPYGAPPPEYAPPPQGYAAPPAQGYAPPPQGYAPAPPPTGTPPPPTPPTEGPPSQS